jgi:hypothetical protein
MDFPFEYEYRYTQIDFRADGYQYSGIADSAILILMQCY